MRRIAARADTGSRSIHPFVHPPEPFGLSLSKPRAALRRWCPGPVEPGTQGVRGPVALHYGTAHALQARTGPRMTKEKRKNDRQN